LAQVSSPRGFEERITTLSFLYAEQKWTEDYAQSFGGVVVDGMPNYWSFMGPASPVGQGSILSAIEVSNSAVRRALETRKPKTACRELALLADHFAHRCKATTSRSSSPLYKSLASSFWHPRQSAWLSTTSTFSHLCPTSFGRRLATRGSRTELPVALSQDIVSFTLPYVPRRPLRRATKPPRASDNFPWHRRAPADRVESPSRHSAGSMWHCTSSEIGFYRDPQLTEVLQTPRRLPSRG
jgi:hypothetical protein